MAFRPDISLRKDLEKGSRPPPQRRPATSAISILFIMALVVTAAFVASGNAVPVDPNGPGGPPTLEPYYNTADYPVQHIITPTGGLDAKKNLQLKTFQVDNCGQNSAMLFLIDTSGSMQFAGKMNNTKKALQYFINNMGGKSVIGIDTFSKDVKEEVPLSYYKDVKPQVAEVINSFKPDGWTRTKDAMEMAYEQLRGILEDDVYPGYKYNLILMTDGVPEIPNEPRTCYVTVPDPNVASGQRCFAQEQDPTVPVNLPLNIKNLGVDIYVINVYSPSYPSDAALFPYLNDLLKNKVASTPTDTHYFVSTNASNLSAILNNVVNSICYNDLNGAPKVQ